MKGFMGWREEGLTQINTDDTDRRDADRSRAPPVGVEEVEGTGADEEEEENEGGEEEKASELAAAFAGEVGLGGVGHWNYGAMGWAWRGRRLFG